MRSRAARPCSPIVAEAVEVDASYRIAGVVPRMQK
jgi:hypothetical protein